MAINLNDVRCQIIPLVTGSLVLPNTAVAEIIGYQRPTEIEGAPKWVLGTIRWRGLEVPLVNLDDAAGQEEINPPLDLDRCRLAVVNTITGGEQLPFYAVLSNGIPHLVRLNEEAVASVKGAGKVHEFCTDTVSITGENAVIPKLDAIEQALIKLGLCARQLETS